MELHTKLEHTLDDVLIDENEIVDVSSQSHVMSILAYVEVGGFRIFKSTLVSQLNGNPTLLKNLMTQVKTGLL